MIRRFAAGGSGAVDGTWVTMALTAGTPNGARPPQYMKDSRGIVHCRGLVTVVSAGAIFTLPAGFWPYGDTHYFHYNTPPHGCTVTISGLLSIGNAGVTADLSVIHFVTALIP